MNILGISGSLRRDSRNTAMLRYAASAAPEGVTVAIADISGLPFFNSDIDRPAAVDAFFAQLESADALLLACPEYNYSIAPALKNALDWASRETDNRLLKRKVTGIVSAGGGMGASRAQYHLRQVGVFLDLDIINKPEVFCNAFAGTFDDAGNLTSEPVQQSIAALLTAMHARFTRAD